MKLALVVLDPDFCSVRRLMMVLLKLNVPGTQAVVLANRHQVWGAVVVAV